MPQAAAEKIMVSNLPPDVNEQQIRVSGVLCCSSAHFLTQFLSYQELFLHTVGPLRDVTLHYDSSGRSKGVASVHFQKKGDGNRAYDQYNNRLIDSS